MSRITYLPTLTVDGGGSMDVDINSGSYRYDLSALNLEAGTHQLVLTATDSHGNKTTLSKTLIVDEQMELTAELAATSNGGSKDDTLTHDTTPELTGVTDANVSVTIEITQPDGSKITSSGITSDANGVWRYTPSQLASGSYDYTVSATDGSVETPLLPQHQVSSASMRTSQ